MNPVYLFIGQSGAGKGTQVALLKERLLKDNANTKFFFLETGEKFRELIAGNTHTATLTRELMSKGILPPPFLAIHIWSHLLIENYDGNTTVFIDGTPRVPAEVPLLLSAAEFYGWTINILYLNVSDEWSTNHLKGRARADDTDERIAGRIAWFHASVEPSMELLKESPLVRFHEINGEQHIEDVHRDVCASIGI
ncbi:MAG: adk, adenylate kinase, adenylate kinase [Candidatus Nomurabacteria bacterium]|nr:adk, adenylate kinase, adenylate kinase [Candidatus Nomurabacteria bacterium]